MYYKQKNHTTFSYNSCIIGTGDLKILKLHSPKGSCNFENFQNHSYLLITNCTRGCAISYTYKSHWHFFHVTPLVVSRGHSRSIVVICGHSWSLVNTFRLYRVDHTCWRNLRTFPWSLSKAYWSKYILPLHAQSRFQVHLDYTYQL